MEYVSAILSLIAIAISILAWRKSRVIYGVRKETDKNGMEIVNGLLKTGEYTILHVQPDPSNSMHTIYILGKIAEH